MREGHSQDVSLFFPSSQCQLCTIFKYTHQHTVIRSRLRFHMIGLLLSLFVDDNNKGVCNPLIFIAILLFEEMFILEQNNPFPACIMLMKAFIEHWQQ